MSRRSSLSLTLWSLLLVGVLVACGPSESEVEQMVDKAVQVRFAQLEKEVREWMDAETRRVNEWIDKDERMVDERNESLQRSQKALDEANEILREYRFEVSEAFIRLEQALCQSDYQANSTRSALWWTLDNLTGGSSTLEDAKATWLAMVIRDDYGEVSTICDGRDDGTLLIKPTWD